MESEPAKPHEDIPTIILYRLQAVEESVKDLQAHYVPTALYEMRVTSILDAVNRLDTKFQDIKDSYAVLSTKLEKQQDSATRLQIKVLASVVSTFVGIIVAVLVGYLTHFIH